MKCSQCGKEKAEADFYDERDMKHTKCKACRKAKKKKK